MRNQLPLLVFAILLPAAMTFIAVSNSLPLCLFVANPQGTEIVGAPIHQSASTYTLEERDYLIRAVVHAVNVTPAYLFRKVGDEEAGLPTILYDEVDTLFGSKVQDTGEVRGLLNAGHRRGAKAGRCIIVGNKVRTEEIPAYCAWREHEHERQREHLKACRKRDLDVARARG